MFVRSKKSGQYEYLQVVHNERLDGRVQQRVVATLGRLDVLARPASSTPCLASCTRFAEHSAVLIAQRQGRVSAAAKLRIGPPLVFQRLWEELGLPKVLGRLLAERSSASTWSERSSSRCSTACSLPAVTAPPKSGGNVTPSQEPKDCNCTASTAPWLGWENRCRRANRPTPRLSRRVV